MRLRTYRTVLQTEMCRVLFIIYLVRLQEILDLGRPHLVKLRHLHGGRRLIIAPLVKANLFFRIITVSTAAGGPIVRVQLS
jgi:hypothetical protein